jgi:hypothetical protein
MNDSFRTNVFVRFNPETIACACIYLAARQLQIPLPNNPHWFLLFGIKEQDIRRICLSILQLYTRSKPNADELERLVGEIKKRHIEAKLKAKELAAAQGATPNSTSAPNTPEKFGLSPSVGKKRTEHEKQSDHGADRKDQSLGTRRKRSRSRSRSRSDVKKARSDDSGEQKSYNSSSRSRSRSPKSKGRQQQQQQQQHGSRHTSKKDDYLSSYSRQKQVKYDDKYNSSNNRDWKKRKSSNSNSRSETATTTIELSKYSKYTSHDSSKKDRYQKLDAKTDDKYEKRTTKYTREDVSPPPTNARAYSSSPDRLMAAKKKNKHKSKTSLPDERTDSKKRNGQSRLGHSNHHHVQR